MAPLYPVPKSNGHHKSTNKLTLNEKAMTVVYTGFPMGRCQPSSGVPTNDLAKCFEPPSAHRPLLRHNIERFWVRSDGGT